MGEEASTESTASFFGRSKSYQIGREYLGPLIVSIPSANALRVTCMIILIAEYTKL